MEKGPVQIFRNAVLRFVQKFPGVDRWLLIRRRRKIARSGGYTDWKEIIQRNAVHAESGEGVSGQDCRILIATSSGGHLAAMQLETVLAAALRMRGAEVEALLCDEILPGCQMCEPRMFPDPSRFVISGPQRDLCGFCYSAGRRNYEDLGIKVHRFSESLTDSDHRFADQLSQNIALPDIEGYALDGMEIGQHAKAGALRFFARATIDDEPTGEAVLRRYFKAAVLTAQAVRRLMSERHYTVAVFHHGIYVPQGVIGEAARKQGVRVVNWNPAYRANCFLFSHRDTYHHTLMDEPVAVWLELEWTDARRNAISSYLKSRWNGDNDWIKFHRNPLFEKSKILAEIGCDPELPIIGCLTNVMWDAQLHYPANAFSNMLQWLIETIDYFSHRPELQLVIRVHPAEITGSVPTMQPVVAELARHFPVLPPNVFVIAPESDISTYVLAELCNTVLIFGTKTGVELTSVGIPVIVAGEAWIRNKGITSDAVSRADYLRLLDALPSTHRLSPEVTTRALRYAFHFFFRRMIPVRVFEKGPGWPPYRFAGRDLSVLRIGADPGLDCICDGILRGAPFVFDDADLQ